MHNLEDFNEVIFTPLKVIIYPRICTICGIGFETKIKNKNICSFECRKEHNRQHSLYYVRKRRNLDRRTSIGVCIVCGFNETIDLHSENGKKYALCPNHHALITRNIKTLRELLTNPE